MHRSFAFARFATTAPARLLCQVFGRSVFAALVIGALLTGPVRAARWNPVDPKDLAATDSTSLPGVDAEILLSTQDLNERNGAEMEKFVRAKVYTRKGVEDQKFSILYPDNVLVSRPEARVVKPDGSSTELKKEDIFDTVAVKWGEDRWKRISFVFPNLAPGDVIEYRWSERSDGAPWVQAFFCQEPIPVREFHFSVTQMSRPGSVSWFNTPTAQLNKRGGNLDVIAHDLPAFEEEEFMPAQREFRGWISIVKTFPAYSGKDVWTLVSSSWGDDFEAATRGGGVKAKALEVIAGATTDDEKLRRLYEFCQREITNYDWVNSPEIQAAREKSAKEKSLRSPKRVLEDRAAWGSEINQLFAALARAVGYKVREARNASRMEITNVRGNDGWAYMNRIGVAVEVAGQWRYFRPGAYFLPYGMLDWRDEGTTVFRCDSAKDILFDQLPAAPADGNQVQRKGRFRLDEEGTLEGEVELELSGHPAIARKIETWKDSLEDVSKEFREEITKRMPNAEVSNVVWTNLRTYEMPLKVTYQLRVPGYAEAVGRRMMFAPSVFEVGAPVVFAPATRKYPIVFPYARAEHDDIEIALPEGFVLDKPSAPPTVAGGGEAIKAAHRIQYNGKTRTLGLKRDFILGSTGLISFKSESYSALKGIFEQIHKADAHSIMLKPKEAPSPAAAPAGSAATGPAAQP